MRRRREADRLAVPSTLLSYNPTMWEGRDDSDRMAAFVTARRTWAAERGFEGLPDDDKFEIPDGTFRPEEI